MKAFFEKILNIGAGPSAPPPAHVGSTITGAPLGTIAYRARTGGEAGKHGFHPSPTSTRPTDTRPFADFGRPFLPRQLVAWVSGQSQEPLLTAEEIEILRGIAEKRAGLTREIEANGVNAVRLALRQHQDLGEVARDPGAVTASRMPGRDEVESELRGKRKILKAARRELCAPAAEILRGVASKVGVIATGLAEDIGNHERAEAEILGIDFFPSKKLVLVGQLGWRHQELSPAPGTDFNPTEILKIFGIDL